MDRRRQALAIVASVVPSDWGDARFARILGGRYTPGYGTTCGYLTSYVLYELGCREALIVNRDDPASGLTYHVGENVSRLVSGAKALGAWREGPGGMRPGDMYFITNGPPESEHVGILVRADGRAWTTADAGQRNPKGEQAARYVSRAFDGKSLTSAGGGLPRALAGYVDIDALPLGKRGPELAAVALVVAVAALASS